MRRVTTLLLLVLVPAISAQIRREPLTERVEVSIINVDATVAGPDGAPALGLTAEDFEILEDGKPQKITNFHAIQDSHVKSLERADGERDQFRRKVLLMIDNTSINQVVRDRAIADLEKFIANDFREDHEWSVSIVGADVRTLQSFTSSRDQIQQALARAKETPTLELQREADRRLLSDPVRARMRDAEFSGGYDFGETARFQARENTMRALRSTGNFASSVIQTTRAHAAVEGKKVLILITGGLDIDTSFGAYESKRDRNMRDMRRELEQIFDVVTREVNAANFSMYVVNARGRHSLATQHDVSNRSLGIAGTVKSSSKSENFSGSSDISNVDGPALLMALGTGGAYLAGNDLEESFNRIDQTSSNFYSLGYSPSHREDGRYHQIEVRLKKSRHTVSHRAGYMHLTGDQRFEQSLRAALTFPKEKGSLGVSLELGVPKDPKRRPVEIPLRAIAPLKNLTLLPRDSQYVGRVHVYVTIFDAAGNNIGFDHKIQDVEFPARELERAKQGAFRYTTTVTLKEGGYTLIVTLRDDVSNEIGSAVQNVRV